MSAYRCQTSKAAKATPYGEPQELPCALSFKQFHMCALSTQTIHSCVKPIGLSQLQADAPDSLVPQANTRTRFTSFVFWPCPSPPLSPLVSRLV